MDRTPALPKKEAPPAYQETAGEAADREYKMHVQPRLMMLNLKIECERGEIPQELLDYCKVTKEDIAAANVFDPLTNSSQIRAAASLQWGENTESKNTLRYKFGEYMAQHSDRIDLNSEADLRALLDKVKEFEVEGVLH